MFTQLNVQTVLLQAIQFSISMQFSSIWLVYRALSGATTSGQSGPGSDGNKGALRILQSSSITGTSPSDYLVPYPEHSVLGGDFTPLQRCSQCILQPHPTSQLNRISWSLLQKNNNDSWLNINCLFSEIHSTIVWHLQLYETE